MKVEAALLLRVPVPQSVSTMDAELVDQLSHMLESSEPSDEDLIANGQRIDESLFDQGSASSSAALLRNLIDRRHKHL